MISYLPTLTKVASFCGEGFRLSALSDPRTVAELVGRYPCCPGTFRGGVRRKENFLAADWIALDFDDGDPTLADFTRRACDLIHVIGTTKSHQVAKGVNGPRDRFRAWLKLSETIRLAEDYSLIVKFFVNRWDADKSCVDAARFFWPIKVTSICRDADTIDVKKLLPFLKRSRAKQSLNRTKERRDIPIFVRNWLINGVPQGTKNTTCYKIGATLAECGFNANEIVDLIMRSKIPNRHDGVVAEVTKAVNNGVNKALQKMHKKNAG